MARLVGVDLPSNKRTVVALTYIFGIGKTRALEICSKAGILPSAKIGDLQEDKLELIRNEVGQYLIEGDLRRDIATNIKRLQDLGTYRGIRHRRHLPVNGQRTKTNARTCKGPKKPIRR